ncbi:UNVERIFIED_CONTAM: hypothetical protein PYX00_002326 [Menopon gallinae]|uniref:Retrotransposon gag domain-containing protein n=1 Tax=Menopon gallinae TaxID=328185 RepID=A0AAW2IGP4_9NEOP
MNLADELQAIIEQCQEGLNRIREALVRWKKNDKGSKSMAYKPELMYAVPAYTGTDTEISPEDFINSVEQFGIIGAWPDDIKITIVKAKLAGRALRKFKQSQELQETDRWPEFKKRFLEEYRPPTTIAQARADLAGCTQRAGETVEDYEEKFIKLAGKTFRTSIDPVVAKILKDIYKQDKLMYFINGLRTEIKQTVHMLRPKTYQEALNLAIEYEKISNPKTNEICTLSEITENKEESNIEQLTKEVRRMAVSIAKAMQPNAEGTQVLSVEKREKNIRSQRPKDQEGTRRLCRKDRFSRKCPKRTKRRAETDAEEE